MAAKRTQLLEQIRDLHRRKIDEGDRSGLIPDVMKFISNLNKGGDAPTRRTILRWLKGPTRPDEQNESIAYQAFERILDDEADRADDTAQNAGPVSAHSHSRMHWKEALKVALREQDELDSWLLPDKNGKYEKYYTSMRENFKRLIDNSNHERSARLDANRKICFSSPDRYYPQRDHADWIRRLKGLGDKQQSDATLHDELRQLSGLLRGRSIEIIVPLVSLKYYCIVEFIKHYFDLKNLKVERTDITKTAVDAVNEGKQRPDFLVAAAVTLLANARGDDQQGQGAVAYRFGCGFFSSHQRLATRGTQLPENGAIPLYYLENATGELSVQKIMADSPQRYERKPVTSYQDLFRKIHTPMLDNSKQAFSLWEPAGSFYKQQKLLDVRTLSGHNHLIGIFVHSRWREGSDQARNEEEAFYKLIEFGAAYFRKYGNKYLTAQLFHEDDCLDEIADSIGVAR